MRKLDLSRRAYKFIDELPAKQFRQIIRKILSLLDNPEPSDSLNLSRAPFRRTDIGEFRIIYHFDESTVYITLVGKRNDDEIYRRFRPLPS